MTKSATKRVREVKFGKPYEDRRGKEMPDGYEWVFTERWLSKGVPTSVNMHRANTEAEAIKLRRRLQSVARKALA